ncbi:hypothetical protein [Vibrio alfacsensis]|uniref:hypothetical protein n=1 Tax=Vibrio alfacsensis TaxID=1074311 RepID=UPI004068F7F4
MKKVLLILMALALTGCMTGNDLTVVKNRHTTIGQELVDLKKALDENVITVEEYSALKEEIKKSAEVGVDFKNVD